MPKVKQSTLSALIDSDSDDGLAMPAPKSTGEDKAPAEKKGRGRPKAAPAKPAPSKVTKTAQKAPARRTSDRIEAMVKAVEPALAKNKRPALRDKTNRYTADDEMDDLVQDENMGMDETIEDSTVAVKKTKPKATKRSVSAKGRATMGTESTIQETQEASKPDARAAKRSGPGRRQKPVKPELEQIIQETQYEEMDVDVGDDHVMEPPGSESEIVVKRAHNASRAPSHPRQRQPSAQRRRAGSASDTERGDPSLRRKLGEVTKKYEILNLKYQDLREIGIKEAARNFDSLRREDESKTKSGCVLLCWFSYC